MKNQDRYAVAVRKPDHQIDVKVENYKSTIKNEKIRHLPIVRGVVNFVESLVLGMSTLMYSASFFEDEEEDNKKKNLSEEEREKLEEKEEFSPKRSMCRQIAENVVSRLAVIRRVDPTAKELIIHRHNRALMRRICLRAIQK